MDTSHKTSFQFISEPSDINFGGKVHGGVVMKWIDQAAYTCARTWSESYCVTVYVGGIRFYKPINIGEVIKVDCSVIYTGSSSIHIMVEVYSRDFSHKEFEKKTHCIIIFVSVDENGSPKKVKPWVPQTDQEKKLEEYATRLKSLREDIHNEMKPFFNE
ncbi:acyl-CoA thioesterase [Algoriphagus aquimarinus]|uniref:Acyl-CoA hydrolase n=1 Tax=Algoriphagus aquimarinus TaxID=237018 RepID=A0A1I0XH76_9BACT|nr:acyl-CoA thioesterase [Algoriphagus aquimarinus]SFA99660.1 Acyl-CoA hydrolase [Algoriphagus aquimarinus]|tara:strand:- start:130825 stop:131301 length:477 start_codon:yes stop_codon:yes gene_type:complete